MNCIDWLISVFDEQAGLSIEGNPLILYGCSNIFFTLVKLVIASVAVAGLVWFYHRRWPESRLPLLAMAGGCILYAYVAANNLLILLGSPWP
jgi:hypothetical protein